MVRNTVSSSPDCPSHAQRVSGRFLGEPRALSARQWASRFDRDERRVRNDERKGCEAEPENREQNRLRNSDAVRQWGEHHDSDQQYRDENDVVHAQPSLRSGHAARSADCPQTDREIRESVTALTESLETLSDERPPMRGVFTADTLTAWPATP